MTARKIVIVIGAVAAAGLPWLAYGCPWYVALGLGLAAALAATIRQRPPTKGNEDGASRVDPVDPGSRGSVQRRVAVAATAAALAVGCGASTPSVVDVTRLLPPAAELAAVICSLAGGDDDLCDALRNVGQFCAVGPGDTAKLCGDDLRGVSLPRPALDPEVGIIDGNGCIEQPPQGWRGAPEQGSGYGPSDRLPHVRDQAE